MLIIVEGPDGVGKTTFVSNVAKLLRNAEVKHFGPPKSWPLLEYESALQSYKPGSGRHVVCDRLHVGELIYGPLYRGKTQLSEWDIHHITMFLAARGALIVYLDAPDDTLLERVTKRGDDFIDMRHLPGIAEAYRTRFHEEELPALRGTERFAIAVGGRLESGASQLGWLKSYVGPTNPTALLIGDKRSGMAGELESAFVTWKGKSGEALMYTARRAFFNRWGVLNAADDDVAKAIEVLNPASVIALGTEARAALDATEIGSWSFGSVPHPVLMSRWGMDRDRYASALVKAASGAHVQLKELK